MRRGEDDRAAPAPAPRPKPDLSAFGAVTLRNAKTGEPGVLTRADRVAVTPERLAAITRICNDPLVYDFLFRRSLRGAPYPPEMAQAFLDGAGRGWREGTGFVFLILDPAGAPLGNVDLMSPDVGAAELGYWATGARPGFVTPAVAAVCDLARAAGYRSLFAHTRPHNERSMAVLRRNGFRDVGLVGADADRARKFVKPL